jgi:hypothetical protein
MSRYIDNAADCVIKQYMECAFKDNFKVLVLEGEPSTEELKRAFALINDQYADISELFITREFELSAYMHSLQTRINSMIWFINLQKQFIEHFGEPYVPAFHIAKKYGHRLFWNPDSPDITLFLNKLEAIPGKEAKYKTELAAKEKELFEMRRKKVQGELTPLETRKQFISMLNRLQQARFVVDKDKTTVEELALMIKDMKDQKDEADAQKTFKKK